ncbi:MAG: hypothetical protein ACR2OO_09860 [Thermomicrobiales bacterium]
MVAETHSPFTPRREMRERTGHLPLRRYERPIEAAGASAVLPARESMSFEEGRAAIAGSAILPGAQALVLGLLRTGTTRFFPGGGVGIEYSSLLKTAVRPDYLAGHVREVAAHLAAQRIDLLLVPGMSGYPVGAGYAMVAGLPAILLKKQKLRSDPEARYPAGSFAIPSYTGEGDVVISADLDAVRDIVACVAKPQIAAQADSASVLLTIRAAGADDIIDKATMAHAITDNAPLFCQPALDEAIAAHRARTGDRRPIASRVEVATWVTPLIKAYNGPCEHLMTHFGIRPFAGVTVTSVHLDPCAIGIEGVGVVRFASGGQGSGIGGRGSTNGAGEIG